MRKYCLFMTNEVVGSTETIEGTKNMINTLVDRSVFRKCNERF